MAKVIVPKADGKVVSRALEQELAAEANLIAQFLEMMQVAGKKLEFQYRSGRGQKSGCKDEHALHAINPETVYHNGAWTGFKVGNVFYRTETVKCRNAFIDWIKATLTAIRRQTDYWRDMIVPPEICFVSPVTMVTKS